MEKTTVNDLKKGDLFLFGGIEFKMAFPYDEKLCMCYIRGTVSIVYISKFAVVEPMV